MAKAEAKCTCATCGKGFTVIAFRQNRKGADEFEAWAAKYIDECDECKMARLEAKRAAENAASASAAADRGWPQLIGSEKQVAWANTIREQGLSKIIGDMDKVKEWLSSPQAADRPERAKARKERLESCVIAMDVILSKTKASWWIDNRNGIERLFEDIVSDVEDNPEAYKLARDVARAEESASDDLATIAEPAEKKHDGVAEIQAAEDKVSVAFRKSDAFREIVKNLGYRWDPAAGRWSLAITYKTGASSERAAELGNKLLNAGFAIRIQDVDTLRAAVAGTYEPMTKRWISVIKGKPVFVISWGREDDLYGQAKRLPRARYVSPDIQVPATEYAAVLDFADAYGFKMTAGAAALVAEMQGETIAVTPSEAKNPTYDEHPIGDILSSSRDVLGDLMEDA